MRSRFRGASAITVVMALVVVVAGGWFGFQRLVQPSCAGQVRLTVAAAPEIAPAIQAASDRWVEDGGAVDGVCVAVDVAGTDPAEVAANVASQHGVSLAGVGQASGGAAIPDVWLPDSSMWLLRLRTAGASAFAPTNGASVARSPVVVAMPEPVAAKAGWPKTKITWSDLLRQITTGTKLRTGIVEPSRDAAGLSGLLSLGAAAGAAGADAQKATTAALRALATGRSALRQDLLARFPRAADPASIASSLSAAALSEEDVIEYNAKKPPVALAALYLEPAPLSLDYPYAVMPGGEPAKIAAAERLFSVLNTPTFRNRLGAQGLRAADGTWGDGFAAPQGAPSPAGTSRPASANPGGATGGLDPNAVDKALSTWTAVTQPGRMLAVIDVSGSMLERVPTAGNITREQVTVAAALGGLNLLDDSWSLGIWTFSTDLVGSREYRVLMPIGPLSSQRQRADAALRSIVPKKGGDTGLYDTVLGGYRTVQDGWEPGRVNSVVVFTDGQNDNASGITQEKLLAELTRLKDPERPVQVIFIGIGAGVSRTEMDAITKISGGGSFVTEDPAKIGDILLKAIALRPR